MRIVLTLFTLFITLAAAAQTPGAGGIVYGADHAFAIKAPPGWILDNSSGAGQGLHAVFHEEGETWAHASTVMYANTASKRVDGQRTREELMAYDASQFTKRAPKLRITSAPEIKTAEGTSVVRLFEGDEHGNFEAVAYIDEKPVIVMLVLSARTKENFDKAYPAFETLVRSYRFLTPDVR